MAGSVTSILDLIEPSQAQKEVTANALFEAASPAMLYARRARTSAGFTWGYYGGTVLINGTITTIDNGTLTLTANRGNWIEADPSTGEISVNNTGFTAGRMPLYLVLTDGTSIVGYEDLRSAYTAATTAASGSLAAHLADPDPHPQYMTQAEADARYASLSSVADVMVFKGVLDCSTNPNYPAADAGHVYKVSVAGKVGGASGVNVEPGDTLYCITDATASGNHATVGGAWAITQTNIDGVVSGPATATDNALAVFNGTTGKSIKDSAVTLSTDGTFAGNSDALVPTQKAIKTYVAATVAGVGSGAPGGANKQIQFNDSGAFAGAALLTWDKTNNILYCGNSTGTGIKIAGVNSAGSADGATVTVKGGDGAGGFSGGKVVVYGGLAGGGASSSGGVEIYGCDPAISASGPVTIKGGAMSGGTGGAVTVAGGSGMTSADGGPLTLNGGDALGTWTGGGATLRGGDGTGNGAAGGNVTIRGGSSFRVTISGAPLPGNVSIVGGAATGGLNTAPGGSVTVKGGAGGANNANGGNVFVAGGAGGGTGSRGNVAFNDTNAALATTATGGFVCLPSMAGTPTGTPADVPTGTTPFVFDTTGQKLWTYSGGAWVNPAGSGGGGGGGTPGGSTSQIQFNDAGAFAGSASLGWDKTNNILYVGPASGNAKIQGTAPTTTTSAGTSVTLQGGSGGSSSGVGGDITIKSGPANGTSAQGNVYILGNDAGPGGYKGGAVTIKSGYSGNWDGTGADILIQCGSSYYGNCGTITIGNDTGHGNVNVLGGSASSGSTGGAVKVQGGTGGGGASGGIVTAAGGDGINPGAATFRGGDGSVNTSGGNVTLRGGNSNQTSYPDTMNPGTVTIKGGNAGGGNNLAAGGVVSITGGNGGAKDANGGNVIIAGGAGGGTGARGNVAFNDTGAALATTATGGFTCLPTCAGTPTGTPANVPAGCVAAVIDTTNSKLCLYIGGAWKSVTLT
jgi:hypothetical protein